MVSVPLWVTVLGMEVVWVTVLGQEMVWVTALGQATLALGSEVVLVSALELVLAGHTMAPVTG